MTPPKDQPVAVKLTTADVANWHMREAAHYNGGEVFFAYLHRCIEQPRLSRFDKYPRKTRAVESTWRTDGADQPSLETAVEALNTPPVFDAEELAFLTTMPTEWTKKVAGTTNWELNERVVNKGAVEWDRGSYRITDLGRAALTQEPKP